MGETSFLKIHSQSFIIYFKLEKRVYYQGNKAMGRRGVVWVWKWAWRRELDAFTTLSSLLERFSPTAEVYDAWVCTRAFLPLGIANT